MAKNPLIFPLWLSGTIKRKTSNALLMVFPRRLALYPHCIECLEPILYIALNLPETIESYWHPNGYENSKPTFSDNTEFNLVIHAFRIASFLFLNRDVLIQCSRCSLLQSLLSISHHVRHSQGGQQSLCWQEPWLTSKERWLLRCQMNVTLPLIRLLTFPTIVGQFR